VTDIDRGAFEAQRPFPLDPFQVAALDALDAGHSVLVAAPTGSGKTLVAEYAIAKALATGTKAFYTTPLKALSNQKFTDLVRVHGAARVGLLTGDNSINGDAPIVVMTTEVLRNMIYAASPTLDGLRYVVLDEVHYLQNRYRGAVWEEVIIHLPQEVDLVALSATVSNAEEVAAWMQTVRGETQPVIEERRPVELVHLYLAGDRGSDGLHLVPTFVDHDGELTPNPVASRLDQRAAPSRRGRRSKLYTPWRSEVVERLWDEQMLPAIDFVFSRAGCDAAVQQCIAGGLRLTTSAERTQLRQIADDHTAALSDDELDVLGYDEWRNGMEAGFAAHHAGLVPPMKEAVEEAFAAGLLKVVFATETLSLGINMPARTVVIEKLSKFTGEHHEFLTAGEYTQLAGRAGRRGIDDVGYVVVLWDSFVPFEQVAALASRRSYALTSVFRPTYNMAANLVQRYPPEQARHLLNLSFAQYHADRDVVSLERQLERSREQLARARAAAESPYGDIVEYRRLRADLDSAKRTAAVDHGATLQSLRPGDVVLAPRRGGRAVVLKQERGRRGSERVLALTASRDLVRLGTTDFRGPVRRVAHIDLPRPFAPRSPAFQRAAADALRRADVVDGADAEAPRPRDAVADLEESIRAHPLTGSTGLEAHLRAAGHADRIERDIARFERRVAQRGDSLGRQFDRVLGVLEAWGYLEGWGLSDAGRLLARLNTEADLVLAESLREGLLDDVEPTGLAALVSCFAYERRGSEGNQPLPPRRWPSQIVARRARAIDRIWRDLNATERDERLAETRPPDPGFTASIYAWATGDDLGDILEDEEMTGGDFVRNVKQVIDLLRQVGEVAPNPATSASARAAADLCLRGVVAASSLVTVPA
jgi:ATP-dependent RNA helicase HelY